MNICSCVTIERSDRSMVNRRDLKNVHEEAVLRQFKSHLESLGSHLNILDRPEPPEAIADLDGERTWIEITDAFLDKKHAIGLTTYAADDVEHIPDGGRRIVEPDAQFSSVLHAVIEAKYDKATMQNIAAAQGPGILLVGIFTPFNTAADVAREESRSVANLIKRKAVSVFDCIYVYEGTGQRSFHVLYQQNS
jgi:hypothetical protein